MINFNRAVYFDTEFIEDGKTIIPLSIGMTTDLKAVFFRDFPPLGYYIYANMKKGPPWWKILVSKIC